MSQTEVQLIKDSAVVTADIADQAVTLDKLPHGTSSNNGKFLRANNGADPSFETVTTTTINNNADNRVITGSGTANTLEAESAVTINSGRLFIGNTNPAASANADDLCVGNNDGSAETGITLGSNTASAIRFADGGSNSAAVIEFEHGSTNALKFLSEGSERVRIDGSGRLLVGTTTPVTTDSNAHAKFVAVSSAGPNIQLGNNTTDINNNTRLGTINYCGNHGSTFRELSSLRAAADGDHTSSSCPSRLEFYTTASGSTGPAERFRITNAGVLQLKNAAGSTRMSFENSGGLNFITSNSGEEIKVSSGNGDANGIEFWDYTGVNKRLQIDGHGIKFNTDTSQDNALDDYEEGTWSPVFTDDGTSGNSASSYGDRAGWYVKVGNFVNVWFRIGSFSFSGFNTSHSAFIKGLPYAIKGGTDRLNTGTVMFSNVNLDSGTSGIAILSNTASGANNSFFRMFQTIDNAVWVSIKVSQFTSGNNEIMGNFSYQTP